MTIVFSTKERLHAPEREWNFGRVVPYRERMDRGDTIVAELRRCGYEDQLVEPNAHDLTWLTVVHDERMVEHIRSCAELDEDEEVYPHIFPYRQYGHHQETDLRAAGYFCFDVGTVIQKHTFEAAKAAVDKVASWRMSASPSSRARWRSAKPAK